MNRNVLVTGSAKGIGRAIAEAFAENGDNVIINYNTSSKEAELLADKLSSITKVALCKADVSNVEEVNKMFDFIEQNFGGVDVLINNAGIAFYGLITDTTEKDWDKVFGVNIKGAHLVTNRALPKMISNKKGKIVNVSSMWGISGASCEVAYSASKSALIGYTKALAKEVGLSNINVNCVCPGVIMTDMVKNLDGKALDELKDSCALGRLGTPKDVANLCLFLASEKASFITGQAISVDGGFIV